MFFCIEIHAEDLQQVPHCLPVWTYYPMFGVGTGVRYIRLTYSVYFCYPIHR